jgi:hypothetical protein
MFCQVDSETGRFLWHCPQCGVIIRFRNLPALYLAAQAGSCQGCRAKAMLKRNPGLVGTFLDFWMRADTWPQSPSWMEDVPVTA